MLFFASLFLVIIPVAIVQGCQQADGCPMGQPYSSSINPIGYMLLIFAVVLIIVYAIDFVYKKKHPEQIKTSGPQLRDNIILAVVTIVSVLGIVIHNINYLILIDIEEIVIMLLMALAFLYGIIFIKQEKFFKLILFLFISVCTYLVLALYDFDDGLLFTFVVLSSIDYFFFGKKSQKEGNMQTIIS